MDLMELRLRQQPHHWRADMIPEKRIDLPVLPPVTSQAGWRKFRNKRIQRNQIQGYQVFNPNTNSKLETDQKKMLSQLPWSYAEAVKKPNNRHANQPLSKDEDQMKDQSTKATVESNGGNEKEEEIDEDSPLNPDASEFIPIATSSEKDEMTVSATTTSTDNDNEDISDNQLKQLTDEMFETNGISGGNDSEIKIIDEVNGNVQTDDSYVNKSDVDGCEDQESNSIPEKASSDVNEELLYKNDLHEAEEKEKMNDPFRPCNQSKKQEDTMELISKEEHPFGDNFVSTHIDSQLNEKEEHFNFENTEKSKFIGDELNFDELVKNKANYSEAHFGKNECEVTLTNSTTDNFDLLKNGLNDKNVSEDKESNESNGIFEEIDNLKETNIQSQDVNATTETSVDEEDDLLDSLEKNEIQTNGYTNEYHYEQVEMNESDKLQENDSEIVEASENRDNENENLENTEQTDCGASIPDLSSEDIPESNSLKESLFNELCNQDESHLESKDQSDLLNDLDEEEETLKKIEAELKNCQETLDTNELNYLNKLDIEENFFSNEMINDTLENEEKLFGENVEHNYLTEKENSQHFTEVTKTTEEQFSPDESVTANNNDAEIKENIIVEELCSNNHHFDENKNSEDENLQNENILLDDMTSSRDETNDNDSSFEIINDCAENNDEYQEQSQGIHGNLSNDKGTEEISVTENHVTSTPENMDAINSEEDHINLIITSSESDTRAFVSQFEHDELETKDSGNENEFQSSLPQSHYDIKCINSSEEITPVEESIESELTIKEKAYKFHQEDYVPSENAEELLVQMNEEHTLTDQKFYDNENINTEFLKSDNNYMDNDIGSNDSKGVVECSTFEEDALLESKDVQNNDSSLTLKEDEKTFEETEELLKQNIDENQLVTDNEINEGTFNEESDNYESDPSVQEETCNKECDKYESGLTVEEEICNERLNNYESGPLIEDGTYNEELNTCESGPVEEEECNEGSEMYKSDSSVIEGTYNEELNQFESGPNEEEECNQIAPEDFGYQEECNEDLDKYKSGASVEEETYNEELNKCESGPIEEECNEELDKFISGPSVEDGTFNEESNRCESISNEEEEHNEELGLYKSCPPVEEGTYNEELDKCESDSIKEEDCHKELDKCESGPIEEEEGQKELNKYESDPVVVEETFNLELNKLECSPSVEEEICNKQLKECESGFMKQEDTCNEELEKCESIHLDEVSTNNEINDYIVDKTSGNKEINISEDVSLKFTNYTHDGSYQSIDHPVEEVSLNDEEHMLNKVNTEEATSSEQVLEMNKGEEEIKKIVDENELTHKICEADEIEEENTFVNVTSQDSNIVSLTTETEVLDYENNRNDIEKIEDFAKVNTFPSQEFEKSTDEPKLVDDAISHNKEEISVFSSALIEEIPENIKSESNEISIPDEIQKLENTTIENSEAAVPTKPDDSILELSATSLTAAAAITSVAVGAGVVSGIMMATNSNEMLDTSKNATSDDSLIKLENEISLETEDKKSSSTLKLSPKKTTPQISSPNKPSSPVSSKPKVAVGKTTSQALKSSAPINKAQSKPSSSVIKSQAAPKSTAAQAKASATSKPSTPTAKPTGHSANLKSAASPIKVASTSKTTASKPAAAAAKGSTSKSTTPATPKQAVSLTKPTTPINKTTTSLTKSAVPAKPSAPVPTKSVGVGAAKPIKSQAATNLAKPAESRVSKNSLTTKPTTPTSKSSTPATKSTITAKPSATKSTSAAVKLSSSSSSPSKTVATKPSSPTTKANPNLTKASISSLAKTTPTKGSGDMSKTTISKTNCLKPSTPPSKTASAKPTSATTKTPLVTKKPGSPIKQSMVSSSVAKSSSVSESNGIKNNLKTAVNSPSAKPIQKVGTPLKTGVTKQGTGTTDKTKVAQNKTPSNAAKKSPSPIKKVTGVDKNLKNAVKSPITSQKNNQIETKEEEAVTSTTEDFPIEKNAVIEELPLQISV